MKCEIHAKWLIFIQILLTSTVLLTITNPTLHASTYGFESLENQLQSSHLSASSLALLPFSI